TIMMRRALNEMRVALVALALLATPSFGFWVAGGFLPDMRSSSYWVVRPRTHAGRALQRGGPGQHRSGNLAAEQLQ
ncbi:MAG: hypothetical protein ACREHD_34165, partial [Pirellulales bacterium]